MRPAICAIKRSRAANSGPRMSPVLSQSALTVGSGQTKENQQRNGCEFLLLAQIEILADVSTRRED